jgi:multicomponent Na+:H+ antiporter subunit A
MLIAAMSLMLTAAVLAPVVATRLGRRTGYPLTIVFLLTAGALLVESPGVMAGGVVEVSLPWVPELGVALTLRLNGLALLFAMLVLGVGALIMSYAPQYLPADYEHARLYGILTLFAAGMLGLVLAGDVVLLLVMWELTTLCSFLLVGGRGTDGARPATQALVVTGAGGLALLGAVVLLVAGTGTTDVATILATAPQELSARDLTIVGVLVVLAAFTKSAQLPFHFWLPGAMVAITPVSAYLHAATLVKGGIYLLLLFSPLFAENPAWHLTLMAVGLATMLFGAYQALLQHDLKALLAYSTVSQLGFMVALVGVGTAASLAAATVLVAAHALFKATLFMLVGIIDHEAGSRDIRRISGLWRAMPITAGLTALAAMSMAGIPPLVGFVAKEEAFYAFLGTSQASWTADTAVSGALAAGLAVVGAALTFAYSARIIAGAFAGPLVQTNLYEPKAAFLAPAAVSAILGLVLGLVPFVLNGIIDRAVVDTGFTATEAGLALWHGLTPALGLSATAIGLGILIHLRRNRPKILPEAAAPPMLGPILFDRAWVALLGFGALVGRRAHALAAAPHLAGILVLLLLLAAAGSLTITGLDPLRPGTAQPADWMVLAVLLPAVLALARAGDGMAALVLAGTVGLVIAAWLMVLGAPDVALTLLLVEVLTVVVAAPVLARLPDRRGEPAGRGALAGSLVAGLLAGGVVLVMTGRRERSAAAQFYLTEALPATGGSNVVNTILVDFRGLDTLGEIVVLAAAALGLLPLAGRRRAPTGWQPGRAGTLGTGELLVLRVGALVVLPLTAAAALVLFLRGHDQPGGGFIAGLIAGAALAVARMSGIDVRLPGVPSLVSTGLLLALGAAAIGLVWGGSLLEPIKVSLPLVGEVSTSLLFDLGVVVVVVGLVKAALANLVRPSADHAEPAAPAPPAGVPGRARAGAPAAVEVAP